MEIWTRKGKVEFCPLTEYLNEVLKEMKWLKRREELLHDRLFASVVAINDAKMTLVKGSIVDGKASKMLFRFDSRGRQHWRGDKYVLVEGEGLCGLAKFTAEAARHQLEYVTYAIADDKFVGIPLISKLTADDLLQAINQIVVQEVFAL